MQAGENQVHLLSYPSAKHVNRPVGENGGRNENVQVFEIGQVFVLFSLLVLWGNQQLGMESRR